MEKEITGETWNDNLYFQIECMKGWTILALNDKKEWKISTRSNVFQNLTKLYIIFISSSMPIYSVPFLMIVVS